MVSSFDRIILEVPDLTTAAADYSQFLGVEACVNGSPASGALAWFVLPNTVIELRQAAVERPAILGIACQADCAAQTDTLVPNPLQLTVFQCNGERTERLRHELQGAADAAMRVDHLVLRTADAAACIELFGEQLNIRLALDRTVPEWGGRMLFFRAGKMTLEVIESDKGAERPNFFWGLAYQCDDIELRREALLSAGVALSEIRDGRKAGTRVATLKSHCLGIPTLLIGPAT